MAQSPQPANDRRFAIPGAGGFPATNMGRLNTDFHSLFLVGRAHASACRVLVGQGVVFTPNRRGA